MALQVPSNILPPFQIIYHFAFIKFIDIIMHLDIHYVYMYKEEVHF
jgi:hypothetical protein